MTDYVDQLFANTVEVVDEKIKASPATDVVCRNCPYNHRCCDSLVGITFIEAIVLARHIKARPDSMRIIRKLRERYELIKKAFHSFAKKPDGDITAEYFSYHVKCALYQDGRCSAYDVRPIPCHEAYTDPGDNCHTTSTAIDTRAQELLIDVAKKEGLTPQSNLGYKEMNTGLLEILLDRPLRDYFNEALVTKIKRARANQAT
jgi:Fe-S-cluster containining protein